MSNFPPALRKKRKTVAIISEYANFLTNFRRTTSFLTHLPVSLIFYVFGFTLQLLSFFAYVDPEALA